MQMNCLPFWPEGFVWAMERDVPNHLPGMPESAKLEEQKEQLDEEVMQVDMEIGIAKQKAVSAQSLTDSLTTFEDLYQEALPEEKRELIRLRVNQLIWTPEEIKLALLDNSEEYQRLGESQQLVAAEGIEPPTRGL